MAVPQFGTSTIVVNGTVKEIETRSIACNTDDLMYSIPQRFYTPYLFNILSMYPYPFLIGNPYCPCQKFYPYPTVVPQCPPCNCSQNQCNQAPQMIYCNGYVHPSGHSMFCQFPEQSTSRKSSEAEDMNKNIRNKEESHTNESTKRSDPTQNSNDELLQNLDEEFNDFVSKNNYYDIIQNIESMETENRFFDNLLKAKEDFESGLYEMIKFIED